MNSSVCVDASLVIRALVPERFTEQTLIQLQRWRQADTALIAPALLAFEVTATLRRYVYLKRIPPAQGEQAFTLFQSFDIRLSQRKQIFPLAWALAKQFDFPRAYDTAYLALAQLSQCDFWTADEKLYNAVHRELPWVRWIGQVM